MEVKQILYFTPVSDHDRTSLNELQSLLKAEKSKDLCLESAIDDKKQKLNTLRHQSRPEELQLKRDIQRVMAQTR